MEYLMPTSKKRINISLPKDVETALFKLAKRDDLPPATKAIHLIKLAMETDEDDVLDLVESGRDTEGAKFVDHDKAWR